VFIDARPVSSVAVCSMQDLASRARAGKLTLDEFQGGTFTCV